jgi:Carboxypeptidase regulatory-like domain/TonB dependent receptor
MLHPFARLARTCSLSLLIFSLVANFTWAQSETATVSGQVVDPSGLSLTGAQVKLVDIDRDTITLVTTNNNGLYTFPSVRPGRYRMAVTAAGFKVVNVTGVTVNVQDHLEQNFKLVVGSVSESITVEGGAPLVDTESAAVSTVVDRNFAENLPMNGRSFQTLIELTAGVVLTAANGYDSGQFSVNGQRASSNYWMLDGVSANIGIGAGVNPGNGYGGTLGSFSALGGTNSLVSVDAMQEFRIQTSTYAPEFGRTPGAQISIVTRSGTNQFHGTTFDYLRNDVFDANNWFANQEGLPKPKERQNDFGGTFSGPIVKDRTFFFFSYEGLRLRLPETTLSSAPDMSARQSATPALQPYLNAFPIPNGQDDNTTGIAKFNASYSNPGSLDADSLRIDHKLTDKWSLFGRYNYSPSELVGRGGSSALDALSVLQSVRVTIQTGTVGATWIISPTMANDLRFNFSRTTAGSSFAMDNFGGAHPLTNLPFPDSFTADNAQFALQIYSLGAGGILYLGKNADSIQRQINVVDNLSWQKGSHSIKFGGDGRRLSPSYRPYEYEQAAAFNVVSDAQTGNNSSGFVASLAAPTALFHNLGVFAQDTWRLRSCLTLTYGLRWDVDFAPSSTPSIPAVTGYSLTDLSELAFLQPGTAPFKTSYGNFAPRVGLSYRFLHSQQSQTLFRGGFGVFYDLASAETGNMLSFFAPPFAAYNSFSGTFPYAQSQVAPVPISSSGVLSSLYVFNPNLRLPYTLQWNVAAEQSLGRDGTFSASYIGASGRRLLQSTFFFSPPSNPNVQQAAFIDNTSNSDYEALQAQFQRRLSHGLQVLASYTWSHSIDDASASSIGNASNFGVPGQNGNRGNSDFDIRNAFSLGLTYNIPAQNIHSFLNVIFRGWSVENLILARSAQPVDLSDINFGLLDGGVLTNIRPDMVPGQAFYVYGTQCASLFESLGALTRGQKCPGETGLNPAAFTNPPTDPTTGIPLRQGNLPRNYLRAFGATQWDFAVHREFPIHESLKLQFRAEMFNLLNHPNFGPLNNEFGGSGFGLSTQTLAQSLSANGSLGSGSFSPLYQVGGPRSIQLALKVIF